MAKYTIADVALWRGLTIRNLTIGSLLPPGEGVLKGLEAFDEPQVVVYATTAKRKQARIMSVSELLMMAEQLPSRRLPRAEEQVGYLRVGRREFPVVASRAMLTDADEGVLNLVVQCKDGARDLQAITTALGLQPFEAFEAQDSAAG